MNLRKMIFWKMPPAPLTAAPVVAPPDLEVPPTDSAVWPAAASPQGRGLLCTPALEVFFADNHFGLGHHNGANYRTKEALELGKLALVSRFQNTLAELVAQKQTKADRLHDKLLETQGFCDITTARLHQACTHLEREMAVLCAQMDKASEGQGWVLNALNLYQLGFGKGLREAVEFELLAD